MFAWKKPEREKLHTTQFNCTIHAITTIHAKHRMFLPTLENFKYIT